MDVDGLLAQRHAKFRKYGGFIEGEPVEPEKKLNMKRREIDLSQATADIEMEIEKLKKVAHEGKGNSSVPTNYSDTVERLRQEADKEMTNAFISMGLQEKLEAIKMEFTKSPGTPEQPLNPALKERIDRLVQEFKNHLSRPGSYMELKQRVEMLSYVTKLAVHKEKTDKLKKEINEKIKEQVKAKMEIMRSTREKFSKEEQLNEDQIAEVENAKEELEETFKSVNLELVGFGITKETMPGLEEQLANADEKVHEEIEKAIDMAGLRGKIDELKARAASGASDEEIEKMGNEIREKITAVIDMDRLKTVVDTAVRLPVKETVSAGSSLDDA